MNLNKTSDIHQTLQHKKYPKGSILGIILGLKLWDLLPEINYS